MKFTFEQRMRIEEIVPAVIDDPEYAASEIVRLEIERDRLREALRRLLNYTQQLELIVYAGDEDDKGDHEIVAQARAALAGEK